MNHNSSQSFEIQTAGLRDLGPLRQLEQECFGADAWPLIDLIGALTIPGVIRLKAVRPDGQMIGFAACHRDPQEGVVWVATIGVSAAYRRMGVASALLRACEARAGLPRMRLSVRVSNEEAIRLYRKFGYYRVDLWPRYYAGGEDALVLEKQIDIPADSVYYDGTKVNR